MKQADGPVGFECVPSRPAGYVGVLWGLRVCIFVPLVLAIAFGGPVVRLAGIFGAICALSGDRNGAVRQLLNLVALPAGMAAAVHAAPRLSGRFAGWLEAPRAVGLLAAGAAVVVGTIVVAKVLGWVLTPRGVGKWEGGKVGKGEGSRGAWDSGEDGQSPTSKDVGHPRLSAANRGAGALLGAAEGALAAAMLCWMLTLFGPAVSVYAERISTVRPQMAPVFELLDQGIQALRQDPVGELLAEHNPLERVPEVQTSVALAEITADPESFWRLAESDAVQEVLRSPAAARHVEAFRKDPELKRALEARDLAAIVRSRAFDELLNDEELGAELKAQWPKLREQISKTMLEKAERMAEKLGPEGKAKVERARERAREMGIAE